MVSTLPHLGAVFFLLAGLFMALLAALLLRTLHYCVHFAFIGLRRLLPSLHQWALEQHPLPTESARE